MSKISIALCTYNGARFLSEQLNSFLAQTRLPDELVVCDDQSQDETLQIIEAFAARAPFLVRWYANERNLGSTQNFERAIRQCDGDIIALSDQDDVWLPHKLEFTERIFLSDSAIGLVFSDAEIVRENLQPVGRRLWSYTFPSAARRLVQRGRALEVLMKYNVVTGATMAFRSHYRSICLPIPALSNLIHDGWIALIIAGHSKIGMIPKPLLKYRQHPGQQLGVNWQRQTTFAGSTAFIKRFGGGYLKPSYEESIATIEDSIKEIREIKRTLQQRERNANDDEGVRLNVDLISDALTTKEQYLGDLSAHYKARFLLPSAHWQRLKPVIREVRTGRYHRHSRAVLSPLKDLLT
jgi:hypothetical protein